MLFVYDEFAITHFFFSSLLSPFRWRQSDPGDLCMTKRGFGKVTTTTEGMQIPKRKVNEKGSGIEENIFSQYLSFLLD